MLVLEADVPIVSGGSPERHCHVPFMNNQHASERYHVQEANELAFSPSL